MSEIRLKFYNDLQICLHAPIKIIEVDGAPIYFWADGSVTWKHKRETPENVEMAIEMVKGSERDGYFLPQYLTDIAQQDGWSATSWYFENRDQNSNQ